MSRISRHRILHVPCVHGAQTVDTILKDYEHDLETYAKVSEIFETEMARGLSKSENSDATVKMLITYVRNLPTGKGACNPFYSHVRCGASSVSVCLSVCL